MSASKKTISCKLPADLDARLAAAARQRRTSKSLVLREAISAYLAQTGKPRPGSCLAEAADLAGCLAGPRDLSVNPARLKGFGEK